MQKRIAKALKKNPENYLYTPEEKLFSMSKMQESHTAKNKSRFKKAGDAIVKKTSEPPISKEEEDTLLRFAAKSMMDGIKSGKIKTRSLEDVLEEQDKKRGLR
ncbi:MAG TPA: hypothetical protein VMC84_12115 [Methanocella sp.]|uniref:hypothetical protein n=1 Tax=Methanocella sp. TaxID=2052833 RepID=UPI002D06C1AA|nr:hypothetical protein [Methanocella sp.]HTY91912.1 hypothetical protein [Methanocella sp.]